MAIEDLTKVYGLVPTTSSTGTLGLKAPSPAARIGSRISNNLIKMGGYDPMALPYSQRSQARSAGLKELAERLYGIGAKFSGDPARMALYQEMQKAKQPKAGATSLERFGVYDAEGNVVGSIAKSDAISVTKIEQNPNLYLGPLAAPSVGTTQESLERFTVYDKNTGKPKRTVLKSEAKNIDPNTEILGPLADPFPDSKIDDDIETWAVTDRDGNRYKDLINPTVQELIDLTDKGYFLNKTPQLTTAGKAKEIGEIKGWNDQDGLEKRAISYNTLINTGQRIIDNLYENPSSVLATGDIAQVFDQIGEEFKAIGGIFSVEEKNNFINKSPSGQDNAKIREQFRDLAEATAITESQLLDFAYQIAKVRGQEGRGLSDQDFKNFQKIISAGRTAEQKAAALYEFITGVGTEIKSELDYTRALKNMVLSRDPSDREANAIITGINDLYAVGFGQLNNPFAQPSTTPSPTQQTDGVKRVRRKLNP